MPPVRRSTTKVGKHHLKQRKPAQSSPTVLSCSLRELSDAELRALVVSREAASSTRHAPASLLVSPAPPPLAAGGVLRLGSACTGWATEAQACADLNISATHAFGCDVLEASKKFCMANFAFQRWFDDVHDDSFVASAGHVDLFSSGFPCQPFSVQGAGQGAGDPRSDVLLPILQYISKWKPKAILLENVLGFLQKRHKPIRVAIQNALARTGYKVYRKQLNSENYGVPQSRRRVWIVAILKTCQVADFTWPAETPMPNIKTFIMDSGVEPRRMAPGTMDRVVSAMKGIKKATGYDPRKERFIIQLPTASPPPRLGCEL